MYRLLLLSAVLLLAPRADAATLDLSGEWTYAASKCWNKGPHPMGGDTTGTIKMTQKGAKVTLVVQTGRVCRPASMCVFAGKLKGKKLLVTNSATVDSEGGKAKNSIAVVFKDADRAAGKSKSSYRHPGGMGFTWGCDVTLQRKKSGAKKK